MFVCPEIRNGDQGAKNVQMFETRSWSAAQRGGAFFAKKYLIIHIFAKCLFVCAEIRNGDLGAKSVQMFETRSWSAAQRGGAFFCQEISGQRLPKPLQSLNCLGTSKILLKI